MASLINTSESYLFQFGISGGYFAVISTFEVFWIGFLTLVIVKSERGTIDSAKTLVGFFVLNGLAISAVLLSIQYHEFGYVFLTCSLIQVKLLALMYNYEKLAALALVKGKKGVVKVVRAVEVPTEVIGKKLNPDTSPTVLLKR